MRSVMFMVSLFQNNQIVMIEFIILGVTKNQDYHKILEQQEGQQMTPSVIAKFPEVTTLSQINNLHLWIFTNQIILYDENLKVMHMSSEQRIVQKKLIKPPVLWEKEKHFILTDESGKRKYCTSQVYYEKETIIKNQSKTILDTLIGKTRKVKKYFYVPKAICFASNHPYFKMHVDILRIYEEIRKRNSKALRLMIEEENYKLYVDLHKKRKLSEWDNQSLTHSTFDKQLKLLPQFVLSYYLSSAVFYQESHLAGNIVKFSTESKKNILSLYPITDSLYELNGYSDFKFHLSKENLMKFFMGVFQEKQIIIFSKDTNLIVFFCETIFEMLKPFRWEFLYAPFLPESSIDIGESFMPYILGFEVSLKKKFYEKFGFQDKIIVDLDQDVLIVNTPLINLPSKLIEYIDTPLIRPRLRFQRIIDRETETKKNFLCMVLTMVHEIRRAFIKEKDTVKFSAEMFLKLIPQDELPFYNTFINQSMMFRKFVEDTQSALNEISSNSNNKKQQLQQKTSLSLSSSPKMKTISSNINNNFNIMNNSVSNRQSNVTISRYIHEFLNLVILKRDLIQKQPNLKINQEMHVYLDYKFSKMRLNVVDINCDKDLIRYFFNFNQSLIKFEPFVTILNPYEDPLIRPFKKQESRRTETSVGKPRKSLCETPRIRQSTSTNRLSLTNHMSIHNKTTQSKQLIP